MWLNMSFKKATKKKKNPHKGKKGFGVKPVRMLPSLGSFSESVVKICISELYGWALFFLQLAQHHLSKVTKGYFKLADNILVPASVYY